MNQFQESRHRLAQIKHRTTTMIPGHGVVPGLPQPLYDIHPRAIGGLEQKFELRVLCQPPPCLSALVDPVVVEDEHHAFGPSLPATKLLKQLQKQHRDLSVVFGPDQSAGVGRQGAGEVVLLILSRGRDCGLLPATHPTRPDPRIEVHIGLIDIEHLRIGVVLDQRRLDRGQPLGFSRVAPKRRRTRSSIPIPKPRQPPSHRRRMNLDTTSALQLPGQQLQTPSRAQIAQLSRVLPDDGFQHRQHFTVRLPVASSPGLRAKAVFTVGLVLCKPLAFDLHLRSAI